jgi:hypothetical protein
MSEPLTRPGTTHLYTLKDGERWRVFGDRVIVVHPERPPFMIEPDGSHTPLEWIGGGELINVTWFEPRGIE